MRPKDVARGSLLDHAAHALDTYYKYRWYIGEDPSEAHYEDARQILELRCGPTLIAALIDGRRDYAR